MANKEGGGASKEPGPEGNRTTVRSQIEAADIYGLIVATYGSITAKDSRIDTVPAFDVTSGNHASGKFK